MELGYYIKFKDIQDAKDYINAIQTFEYDVMLCSKHYKVDGKSIMGMLSLNISKPLKIVVNLSDKDIDDNKDIEILSKLETVIEPWKCNTPLVLLIGKSGSGKSTIAKELEKKYGLKILTSYTTREQRNNKDNDHIFINDEYFEILTSCKTPILAETEYNNHKYCATISQGLEADIYIVNPEALKSFNYEALKTFNKNVEIVYINANEDILMERMLDRGNSVEEAENRIEQDKKEFGNISDVLNTINSLNEDCNYMFFNNTLEDINYITDKIYSIYVESAAKQITETN